MDEIARAIHSESLRLENESIQRQVGVMFRRTIHVTIVKPRWMPARLYFALMRTIVVEMGPSKLEQKIGGKR